MTNLEPRAKIGDLVITRRVLTYPFTLFFGSPVRVTNTEEKTVVREQLEQKIVKTAYVEDGEWTYLCSNIHHFKDHDILKNLTTNISYE